MIILYHIAVIEELGGRITGRLELMLDSAPDFDRVLVTRTDKADCLEGYYDFIAVSGQVADMETWGRCQKARCGILLVPGRCAGGAAQVFSPECIVAYGMSARDTITLSSIEEKNAVVALQRELLTLERRVLDRQEIPVKVFSSISPEEIMVVVGSLLIMGVDTGRDLDCLIESMGN